MCTTWGRALCLENNSFGYKTYEYIQLSIHNSTQRRNNLESTRPLIGLRTGFGNQSSWSFLIAFCFVYPQSIFHTHAYLTAGTNVRFCILQVLPMQASALDYACPWLHSYAKCILVGAQSYKVQQCSKAKVLSTFQKTGITIPLF